jgi:hypothetical protein
MTDELQPQRSDFAIRTFADIASDYCAWCEGARASDPGQLLLEATRHVARLYAAVLDLSEVEFSDHPDPPILGQDAWNAMFKSFGALPFNFYCEVFDPSIEKLEEPVVGDLADDLTDIYRDLREGLWLLRHGHERAAVWSWKFTFGCHWGRHAVSALRALHCHGEGESASGATRSTVN